MTIGIVDTGLDSSNTDLLTNIQFNTNDPIDSINNDGDSLWGEPLLDNYMGWDVADWDYNLTNKVESHGSKVAGVSSARTNNGVGISGVGYHCKFMPIKASQDSFPTSISHGYDGLIYAAEKGCQIINLSWGSTFASPELLQDVINYAVDNFDCVIIAAAGNSNLDERYYPASLDNVISVTGVKGTLEKQGRSTYNYAVDLCAVGQYVRTTYPNEEFKNESGTSMAAPVVSGAAALLKSHFPSWTYKQITEQLRVTGDVIDTIGTNIIYYQYKLGKMLNVHKALSDTFTPAIRTQDLAIPNYPNYSQDGEQITFSPTFINYLYNANNIEVSLEIIEGNATLVDSVFNIDNINTLQSYFNQDSIFSFDLEPSLDSNEYVVLKVNYSSIDYNDYEIIELDFTPSVTTSNTATILEENSKSLNVYPNPFHHKIQIESSIEFETVNIYTSIGELVYTLSLKEETNSHTLKHLNLNQGIYVIEVQNKSERLSTKLVK